MSDHAGPGDVATRLEPPVSALSRTFWDATRERRLVLQWCPSCAQAVWYPREVCPRCLSDDLEWRPSTGAGVVYAVSVQHRPQLPTLADRVPYAVALVDLDDGVRMLSNVVDCDPESVRPDMPVELTWEALSDGRNLPLHRPAVDLAASPQR